MSRWLLSQKMLDRWFPTLVRYGGVALMVYAAYAKNVALVTAATAMILFKSIVGDGSRD